MSGDRVKSRAGARAPARADRAGDLYLAFGELHGRSCRDPFPIGGVLPLLDAEDDDDTLPGSKAVRRYQASLLTPVDPVKLTPFAAPLPEVRYDRSPVITAASLGAEQAESSCYARLRLRHDHLARMWVYGLTSRDVVVWSPRERCWNPMLSVQPLRTAVLEVLEACEGSPRSLDSMRQAAAEQGIDTLLGAPTPRPLPGTSTIPPAVLTAAPPEIPRAPRVPTMAHSRHAWSRLASRLFAQVWWQLAERALWVAAGVALVLGGMWALGREGPSGPRQAPGVPSRRAEPSSDSPSLPARAERIYSIADLPLESPATAPPPRADAARPARSTRASTASAPGVAPKPAASAQPIERAPASSPSEGHAFDTEAARRALQSAARRSRLCAASGARGSAVVTFRNAGTVQAVSVVGADGTNNECLVRTFGQIRVPPFSGAPVTVRKRFTIE